MLFEANAVRAHPSSGRIKDCSRIVQPIMARNEFDARERFLRKLNWQPWDVGEWVIAVNEITPTRYRYLEECYSDEALQRTFEV